METGGFVKWKNCEILMSGNWNIHIRESKYVGLLLALRHLRIKNILDLNMIQ